MVRKKQKKPALGYRPVRPNRDPRGCPGFAIRKKSQESPLKTIGFGGGSVCVESIDGLKSQVHQGAVYERDVVPISRVGFFRPDSTVDQQRVGSGHGGIRREEARDSFMGSSLIVNGSIRADLDFARVELLEDSGPGPFRDLSKLDAPPHIRLKRCRLPPEPERNERSYCDG